MITQTSTLRTMITITPIMTLTQLPTNISMLSETDMLLTLAKPIKKSIA